MYFSSIVASLSDAQQNVTGMVEIESQHSNYLKSKIQTPFQTLPQSISSASALANSLQSSSTSAIPPTSSAFPFTSDVTEDTKPFCSDSTAVLLDCKELANDKTVRNTRRERVIRVRSR